MKTITENILLNELNSWLEKYDNGRDDNDQRFGQHIWNNYNLDSIFPERDAGSDGFNEEDPQSVYNIICAKVHEVIKEDYNKEWINLSQQMQRLEIKKIELYNLYRKEYGPLDLKIDQVPSNYYDLNRVNIDLDE